MNFKEMYLILKDSEDLYKFFEGMKGSWKEDKENFINQQKDLESLNVLENNLDLYE